MGFHLLCSPHITARMSPDNCKVSVRGWRCWVDTCLPTRPQGSVQEAAELTVCIIGRSWVAIFLLTTLRDSVSPDAVDAKHVSFAPCSIVNSNGFASQKFTTHFPPSWLFCRSGLRMRTPPGRLPRIPRTMSRQHHTDSHRALESKGNPSLSLSSLDLARRRRWRRWSRGQ